MKNILIYGASGHARMIVDIIHRNNSLTIKGFVDSYKSVGEIIDGYKVIGDLEQLSHFIQKLDIEGIVVAIGDNYSRQSAYMKIRERHPDLEFVSIIHPSAILATGASIGEGTVIMANVVINANAKVGKLCILNTSSILGHDSFINDFSSLASSASVAGNVQVGFCSAICLDASVIQNVIIGNNTVIGAKSLVLKSIGDLKKAYGNPITIIKDRAEDSKYLG
ncbi:NeuD/PglB/VioB family sugar acetyltransferase [Winogradskyella flava]|uniref:NeuD/PglB/VioB family sugar acetyltransferase n=1 Tax=Winogradskyella flava TaxID=1884876 RepID=UPI00248FC7F1|nr:NeuD/PglB/VioB family sugar acetyltransferase [Winogradskyella flava]